MKSVTESFAGRASYNVLYPFVPAEWEEKHIPNWFVKLFDGEIPVDASIKWNTNLKKLLFRGFMPRLFEIEKEEQIYLWWESYVRTYLEKDLRDLSNISSLPDFKRVMELLALRTGSLVEQTGISNDTGISQPTVHRYLNILEESLLFTRLKAYTVNKSKSVPSAILLRRNSHSYSKALAILEFFRGVLCLYGVILQYSPCVSKCEAEESHTFIPFVFQRGSLKLVSPTPSTYSFTP